MRVVFFLEKSDYHKLQTFFAPKNWRCAEFFEYRLESERKAEKCGRRDFSETLLGGISGKCIATLLWFLGKMFSEYKLVWGASKLIFAREIMMENHLFSRRSFFLQRGSIHPAGSIRIPAENGSEILLRYTPSKSTGIIYLDNIN